MSGHGGGPITHVPPVVPCDELEFDAYLQSPVAVQVAQLATRQVLEVELVRIADRPAVEARRNGQRVGYIVERLAQLIRCLQAGSSFRATVTSIRGGAVRV